jgi:hypothetical protein
MRIYKIANDNEDVLGHGVERKIRAYHGSSEMFGEFDHEHSAMGIFWFTEDIEDIKNGTSGAVSNKYIATVELSVKNTAGWEEYESKMLQQIEEMGFDSIKLDDTWVIFDSDRIKIIDWEQFK